jgi:glycosyltransferase involved in cell wall biosynthesis
VALWVRPMPWEGGRGWDAEWLNAPKGVAVRGKEPEASDHLGVAILPWGDRFEDFHDKIGVSFEDFRDELTGGWLFNYVEALQRAGLRPVLYYASARISEPLRFRHRPTGVAVRVLPSPWLHGKVRAAQERYRPGSPGLRSVASYLATPLRPLARELRADRCGVILCHEYEYPRFDVAVGLGRWLGLPVFATFQGGVPGGGLIQRGCRRLAVRAAAGFIIASEGEAQRVRARYRLRPERVAAIPNPLDVTRWRSLPKDVVRSELGIPTDARVVVWQGRVEVDKKGLDVLLDAWRRVWAQHGAYSPLLLLVGTGRDEGLLRQLIQAAPPGSVRWVDRYVMDRELLWRYLAAADIATLPSRREGFAVAVVESMACGLPVVAADAAGVAEALGDGEEAAGIVVPREDAGALAVALGQLIADDALGRALGALGRRRAEERFSLEVVGVRLRQFLWNDAGDGS